MTTEVVLPSGVFASVRAITVADMIMHPAVTGIGVQVIIASRITTFDGELWATSRILDAPYTEMAPVFYQIAKQLEAAFGTRQGIA